MTLTSLISLAQSVLGEEEPPTRTGTGMERLVLVVRAGSCHSAAWLSEIFLFFKLRFYVSVTTPSVGLQLKTRRLGVAAPHTEPARRPGSTEIFPEDGTLAL